MCTESLDKKNNLFRNNYNDIYFRKDYGRLYEKIENGIIEAFEYNSDIGTIKNMFIKRSIPIKLNGEVYYDIITPYGYGGPIIQRLKYFSNMDDLLKGYHNAFKEYCNNNKIVSEFIRFHPINDNAKYFSDIYDVEYVRKTVATNIKDYEDPIANEFKKGCRKEIRKAIKEGVQYKIEKSPNNLDTFKEIYYKTMDRNKANEYYYFDDDYFNQILSHLKDELLITELIFEDKIIASEMYFVSDRLIHAHLVGSLDEFLHLSAGCLLEYATVLWGKENGYHYLHHGGGRTNDEEDSLFKYKKKFGQNTEFDFYVGKKIWNEKVYNDLCDLLKVDSQINFFPAYRLNKK